MDKKQYGWSFSEDSGFDGYYDTLEECFKEARESNEDNKRNSSYNIRSHF